MLLSEPPLIGAASWFFTLSADEYCLLNDANTQRRDSVDDGRTIVDETTAGARPINIGSTNAEQAHSSESMPL